MADVTLPQQDLPQQQVLQQEAVSDAGLPQQHQRQQLLQQHQGQQLLQQASVPVAGLPQPQQKQQVLQQVPVRAAGLPQNATAVERQVHAAKLAVALDEAARWQRLRSARFMGPPSKRQKIYKYAGRAPQPQALGQHRLALALPQPTQIAAPQKLQANLVRRSNAVPSQHQRQQEDEVPQRRRKGRRAHILKESTLSMIPYGQDERLLWIRRIHAFTSAVRGVLGDRRLSQKWGGSVLDSVVGTFCTQNVTDALSSKAFMNLAARFPSASSKQAALVASVQEPTAEQTCGDQAADSQGDTSSQASTEGPSGSCCCQAKDMSECARADVQQACDSCAAAAGAADTEQRPEAAWPPQASLVKHPLPDTDDAVDWDAVRKADIEEVADAIRCRGMQYLVATRVQAFLQQVAADKVAEQMRTQAAWASRIVPATPKKHARPALDPASPPAAAASPCTPSCTRQAAAMEPATSGPQVQQLLMPTTPQQHGPRLPPTSQACCGQAGSLDTEADLCAAQSEVADSMASGGQSTVSAAGTAAAGVKLHLPATPQAVKDSRAPVCLDNGGPALPAKPVTALTDDVVMPMPALEPAGSSSSCESDAAAMPAADELRTRCDIGEAAPVMGAAAVDNTRAACAGAEAASVELELDLAPERATPGAAGVLAAAALGSVTVQDGSQSTTAGQLIAATALPCAAHPQLEVHAAEAAAAPADLCESSAVRPGQGQQLHAEQVEPAAAAPCVPCADEREAGAPVPDAEEQPRLQLSLEWLRQETPEAATEYLMGVLGLGRKSVACIVLLCLAMPEFPVDTNVGRICARLGWIPLDASAAVEELDEYAPEPEVHKYLHSRFKSLDVPTLFELHYQMITLGKVFCAKQSPNCASCPLQLQCEYAQNNGKRMQHPEASPAQPAPAAEAATSQHAAQEGGVQTAATPAPSTSSNNAAAAAMPAKQTVRPGCPQASEVAMPDVAMPDLEDLHMCSTGPVSQAPTCQAGSVRAETAATPEQLQQQAVNQRQQALQLQQDTVDRLLAAEASLAEDEAGVTPPEAQQRLVESAARVMELNSSQLGTSRVRRRGREVSVIVHPDKCHLPDAPRAFAALQRAQTILLEHLEENPQADESGGPYAAQGVARPSRGAVQAVELPASWHLLLPPALVAAYGRNPLLPFLALRLPQVAFAAQQPAGSGPVPTAVRAPTSEAAGVVQAPAAAGVAAADASVAQADLSGATCSDGGPGDSGQPAQLPGDPKAAQPCSRLHSSAATPTSAEDGTPCPPAGSSSLSPGQGTMQQQAEPGHAGDSQHPQVEQSQAAGSQQREADGRAAPLDDQGQPLVRLALLVPCRVAMRGKFPLAGTYFQTNEVFLDHRSLKEPLLVPTELLESLCLRWVYFGHSAPGICRGMRQSEVSQLFNRGFVCVRAWDRVTGEPHALPPWLMPGSFASAEMKPPKPKGRPRKMGDTAQGRPLLTAPPLKPREWHKVKVKRTDGDDAGRVEAKRRQVFRPIRAAERCGKCHTCTNPALKKACMVRRAEQMAEAAAAAAEQP